MIRYAASLLLAVSFVGCGNANGPQLLDPPDRASDVLYVTASPDGKGFAEITSSGPIVGVRARFVAPSTEVRIQHKRDDGEWGPWESLPVDWSQGDYFNGFVNLPSVSHLRVETPQGAEFGQIEVYDYEVEDADTHDDDDFEEGDDELRTRSQELAANGPWDLPGHVHAAGENQHVNYDPAPSWSGGSNCSSQLHPRAGELGDFLVRNFKGAKYYQGLSCRRVRGGSSMSVHGTGRAIDVFIPTNRGAADNDLGDPIANWLVENAAALDVQMIIWDRTIWKGYRGSQKARPYGGTHPHHDHIHIELNEVGSAQTAPVQSEVTAVPDDEMTPVVSGLAKFMLRNQNSTGAAEVTFDFGDPNDMPLACDWNGDGIVTQGIFRRGVFHLSNELGSPTSDMTFVFGNPEDRPLCGDWNGDGVDTVGVSRGDQVYLRNSNSAGFADYSFIYGDPTDTFVVGDWNGNGMDTIGVYRNGTFHLRNQNSQGAGDLSFAFGDAGDKPVVGDWNGNGVDGVGVHRGASFHLTNSLAAGNAELSFEYGDPTDRGVLGDWNGDGIDTVGVWR